MKVYIYCLYEGIYYFYNKYTLNQLMPRMGHKSIYNSIIHYG
ncbi:protein of unknown function [Xenorhabdus poinarii G6]|uniref:Uncharacterized protein n=1 Tax=Xenorhabdus poinarii G6 TaxID=1354304 RepID=A0A068R5Z9_9GAMM|nr:protein of unknown function [Xenorhabdus poinarii G6]